MKTVEKYEDGNDGNNLNIESAMLSLGEPWELGYILIKLHELSKFNFLVLHT